MKVLIADDDESIREYMRLVLEHAGLIGGAFVYFIAAMVEVVRYG